MNAEFGTFPRPQAGDIVSFPGKAIADPLKATSSTIRGLAGDPGYLACLDRIAVHPRVTARVVRHGTIVRGRGGRPVEEDRPLMGSEWVMVECPDIEGIRAFLTAVGLSEDMGISVRRRDMEIVLPGVVG